MSRTPERSQAPLLSKQRLEAPLDDKCYALVRPPLRVESHVGYLREAGTHRSGPQRSEASRNSGGPRLPKPRDERIHLKPQGSPRNDFRYIIPSSGVLEYLLVKKHGEGALLP